MLNRNLFILVKSRAESQNTNNICFLVANVLLPKYMNPIDLKLLTEFTAKTDIRIEWSDTSNFTQM